MREREEERERKIMEERERGIENREEDRERIVSFIIKFDVLYFHGSNVANKYSPPCPVSCCFAV